MKLIYNVIVSTVTYLLAIQGTSCSEPPDSCLKLIAELQSCANFITESLDNWKDLLTCKNAVDLNLVRCSDKVVHKIIEHRSTAYIATEQFFTSESVTSDFTKDENCLKMVKRVLNNWDQFTSDFLTPKGCRYYKTVSTLGAMAVGTSKCYPMITKYIDKLYSLTACARVKVESVNESDVNDMRVVFASFDTCLNFYKLVPTCNSNNERLQCVVNETQGKLHNPNVKYLEKNMIDVVAESNKILCDNEELRNDGDDCLTSVSLLTYLMVDQVNGFHTEEGCEGLKYIDPFDATPFEGQCRAEVLRNFWIEMKTRLPCVEKDKNETNYGEKYESELNCGLKNNMKLTFITFVIIISLFT